MALILSAATGNFNAGATWVGGVVPTVGDEARASTGHTITITANVTCDEVSNAGTGIFTLNDGVTLTANVTHKSTTASRNCLQFTANSPARGFIVGNCTGGTVTLAMAVVNTSNGTLTITGNVFGGSGASSLGANNNSTGLLTITGNIQGGSANFALGAQNISTGTITVVGSVTGGISTNCSGIYNNAAGVVNLTGISTGGGGAGSSSGVWNQSTGAIYVTRIKGNAFGPGNSASPLVGNFGANNVGFGIIEFQELEFGLNGQPPAGGTGFRLKKVSNNAAVFNYVDSGSAKTLVDATTGQMPAATDVRSGVSYASGALTGVAYIPSASSVAFGVPVDNTTGTATLTAADVRAALGMASANLDTQLSTISTKASEVHAIHGLDIANALTVTPTSRTSGAITQAITGDGTTSTVVTRV
jgi:hypothetical protein